MRTPVLIYMSPTALEALLRQYGTEVVPVHDFFVLRGIQVKVHIHLPIRIFMVTYSDGSMEVLEA